MNYDNLDLSILKTIITNKKHALDFINDCDNSLFSSDVWSFANIITGYIKTFKDVPTLRVITERLSKGNNTNLIKYSTELWNVIESFKYDDKEFQHDLSKFKNRFAERQIVNVRQSLSVLTENKVDIKRSIEELEKTLRNIRSVEKSKTHINRPAKEFLHEFVDRFNAKRENPNFDKGVLTKYAFFDQATNGLKPADFVLIAGESGFGKSLLLNNMAIQIWMQDNTLETKNFGPGKNIIYFSLEMPYDDCFNRFISRLSGVPSMSIENAKLTKDEFAKVKQALEFIKNYPYEFRIIDISDACANDLEAIILESGSEFDAYFVDYLGIMHTNDKGNEQQDWLKQGIVSYELRAIARKFSKPMFSAVQLNRKASNKDSAENIGLNRLARSGTIATHATHVLQIESRPNEELFGDFLLHLIKNRKGPKNKGKLIKNLSCGMLLDGDHKMDEEINNQFYDLDDISEEMERLEI